MVTLVGDYYAKPITTYELELTLATEGKGILPEFFVRGNTLYTVAYPMTLAMYIEEHGIRSEEELGDIGRRIRKLISDLHDLGIVHMDLHTQNIVLNSETGSVRLIDLGMGRWISELCEEDMEDCATFMPGLTWGKDYIADLLKYELEMWMQDYFA